jgi:hypothetical protein
MRKSGARRRCAFLATLFASRRSVKRLSLNRRHIAVRERLVFEILRESNRRVQRNGMFGNKRHSVIIRDKR